MKQQPERQPPLRPSSRGDVVFDTTQVLLFQVAMVDHHTRRGEARRALDAIADARKTLDAFQRWAEEMSRKGGDMSDRVFP